MLVRERRFGSERLPERERKDGKRGRYKRSRIRRRKESSCERLTAWLNLVEEVSTR
jgi:hypothetical protein